MNFNYKDVSFFSKLIIGIAASLFLAPVNALHAGTNEVPAKVQAAIFSKIFQYDKALQRQKPFNILVVYADNPESVSVKDEVVKYLKQASRKSGFAIFEVRDTGLADVIEGAGVVYLAPKIDTSKIKQLASEHHVLSITGVPSYVERGDVSVAVKLKNNKPSILIHLGQLKKEGHELAAQLLQISMVIQVRLE